MGLKSVLGASKEATSKKSAPRNESSRPEPVDEQKLKARRRLIGSVALLLIAIIVLPIVLEDEPKPVPEDIQLRIPSKDAAIDLNKASAPVLPPTESASAQPAVKSEAAAPKPTPPVAKPEAPVAKPDVPVLKTEPAKPEAVRKPEPVQKPEPVKVVPKEVIKEVPKDSHKDAVKEPVKETHKPASKLPVVPADDPIAGFANKPASPAVAKSDVPVARSNHWVQIGAFSNESKAREIASQIRGKGFPAVTEVIRNPSGELYRVRVGPLETKESANKAKDNLSKSGFEGALIQ
ncbi:MAG: SPOR domain-containing protein [Burkholderiales bacterium]|nr:SPOR domain-containing protein [Burkholderiales bacterium]